MKAPHHKYTFFLHLLLCFFLVFVNSGCNRKQALSSSSNKEKTATDEHRLLYLTLESIIDSVTGNPNMKIIQQQLVSGELKGTADAESKSGDWQISLLNAKGKRIDSLVMSDPHLNDLQEENSKGEIVLRKIQYIRAEVPLRFNYSSAVKEIEIIELTDDLKNKLLFRSALIL
ncbi:hypothetical protein [Lacibacter sediminis]|uniref:Uncharacterized protein n=1 Tax=Lacibacter sediminis TaxID=2760713 RepID=A0A7G5XAX3_9BACT|nr:hypothetical protein [Lacibacter sediminis]QNA42626.1 hypothetical protein H4075_10950 [Lacibacter sediminis]